MILFEHMCNTFLCILVFNYSIAHLHFPFFVPISLKYIFLNNLFPFLSMPSKCISPSSSSLLYSFFTFLWHSFALKSYFKNLHKLHAIQKQKLYSFMTNCRQIFLLLTNVRQHCGTFLFWLVCKYNFMSLSHTFFLFLFMIKWKRKCCKFFYD